MKMKILAPAAVVIGLLVWLNYPSKQQGSVESVAASSQSRTTPVVPPSQSPDFDTRKVAKVAEQAQSVAPEVEPTVSIAEQEQAMALVIQDYNAALNDPAAKKAFEKKFKGQSAEYKKAILAKLKRDEL